MLRVIKYFVVCFLLTSAIPSMACPYSMFWSNNKASNLTVLDSYKKWIEEFKKLRADVPNLRPDIQAWLEAELAAGGQRATKASVSLENSQSSVGRDLDYVIQFFGSAIQYRELINQYDPRTTPYDTYKKLVANEVFYLLQAARFINQNFRSNLTELVENKVLDYQSKHPELIAPLCTFATEYFLDAAVHAMNEVTW